ncbi:MAG TPA: MaoC/PaaZ C-terminal domain-containing protein [Pyrinomonadaceae bacterium]
MTGDHNPVQVDDECAASTRFGRRIGHGMLAASLTFATLANEPPGPGGAGGARQKIPGAAWYPLALLTLAYTVLIYLALLVYRVSKRLS